MGMDMDVLLYTIIFWIDNFQSCISLYYTIYQQLYLSLFLLAKYQGSDFLTGYFIYNYLSMQRRIICDYCQKSCYKLSARQYFLFSSWILHIVACFIINVEVLEIVVVISSESTKKIFIVKVFYSLSYILISSLFST